VPIFVILAKYLPIFVSVFRLLDCPSEKKSLCRIGEPSEDGKVVKPWIEWPLLGSEEIDSDLYTSLVTSFATRG
jgi:hypothetical protein